MAKFWEEEWLKSGFVRALAEIVLKRKEEEVERTTQAKESSSGSLWATISDVSILFVL